MKISPCFDQVTVFPPVKIFARIPYTTFLHICKIQKNLVGVDDLGLKIFTDSFHMLLSLVLTTLLVLQVLLSLS